jgi:hypothetical protein
MFARGDRASGLALNTGIWKGSQYGLTWDMVDWQSRELHIPRTKNEEPLHLPLNDATICALTTAFEIGKGNERVFTSVKTVSHKLLCNKQFRGVAQW